MKYKLGDFTVKNWNDWDRVPRDPVTIGSFILGSTLTAATTVAGYAIGAAFVGYLATSLVTSWALSALMPKPSSGTGMEGLLVNQKSGIAPHDFVYGEVRKGGTITYYETTGEKNKFLHQIIVLAGHEVDAIGDLYINDEIINEGTTYDYVIESQRIIEGGRAEGEIYDTVVNIKGASTQYAQGTVLTLAQILELIAESGGDSTSANQGGTITTVTQNSGVITDARWKGKIRVNRHLGNQTAPDADLLAESVILNESIDGAPADGPNFIGQGLAYIYVRYEYDRDVFEGGLPMITAKVKGKKVYDPRTGSTVWSSNAALCVRDYIVSSYGLNDTDIDELSFAVAANVCDEVVALADGSTEARYALHGVGNADTKHETFLGRMMTACAGTLFWGAGQWKLTAADYVAPTKTLTMDDLRGPISLDTRTNLRDQFNGVQGTFNNAADRWMTADYPPIKGTAFVAQDNGEETLLDLDLAMTTSSATAQRLAKLTLFRGREQMTLSADFGLNALDVEVGEIIALDIERYGWVGKEFECVGWKFGPSSDAGDLRVTMTLRETSAAAFDWNADELDIINNDTNLPLGGAGLTISGLSATAVGRIQDDGTFLNAAALTWTAAASAFLDHYEVQWRTTTGANYASTTSVENAIELSPIVSDNEYEFRVRAVTVGGSVGPFASIIFVPGGDTSTPNAPTNLTAVGYFKSVTLAWIAPASNTDGSVFADLDQYNVYRSFSSLFSSAVLVGNTTGRSYNDAGLDDNQTYYYWVSAVDRSSNESAVSASAVATTNFISAADMVDDIRSQIDAARIDRGPSLPSTSGYSAGDYFYRTTTKELFEFDGFSFTPVESGTLKANSVVAGTIDVSSASADILSATQAAITSLSAITANLGEVTAGSINTLSSGIGLQANVVGKPNAVYVYQNDINTYGIFATATATGGGATQFTSQGGFTSQFINNVSGSGAFGAYVAIDAQMSGGGKARIGVSSTGGGYGVEVYQGGYYDSSGLGYGPFTGRHDGMIDKATQFSLGDIVVDVRTIAVTLSDCFTEVGIPSEPNQKAAIGVITGSSSDWHTPASFIDQVATAQSIAEHVPTPSDPSGPIVTTHNISDYDQVYDMVTINSLGEGAINVCGEGGDIQTGDLIVTSSVPGKGMKQSDDIVRSYTVAKARESVSFATADDVKMIACIYLCG